MFDGSTPGPGRPKGSKNKSSEELKALILDRTQNGTLVVETLVNWMMHSAEPALVIGSAKLLLEYGFGKPKESIEITGGVKLSLGQLFEKIAETEKLKRIA